MRPTLDNPTLFRLLAAAIAMCSMAVAAWLSEPSDFGRMHDDTIYFSTAKAIAEGRGYVLESVPGEPEQTKYPILYSLILSGVWRVWPEYPANLTAAYALNFLFGALMVLAAAALLRQLGAGRGETLALTAFFGFHAYTLYWSAQLMSDALFAAFGVCAAVCAYAALEGERLRTSLFAAAVAALWGASLTRSLGAAFAVGVATFAWMRGRRLAAAAAATACLPLALSVLRALSGASAPSGPLDGFEQTMLYYTSYAGFWKLSVPDWETFQAQFNLTTLETLKYPAALCFLLPAAGFVSPTLQAFSVAVTVGIVNGIRERARGRGWHPIHLAALAYLPLTLIWNYALATRFWLPFAPLLIAGAAFELRRLSSALAKNLRGPAPTGDRAVSAVFALGLGVLLLHGAWRYALKLPADFQASRATRRAAAEERQAAYRWLTENAPPGSRVVSYEDVALHLATGLQGLRPMAFSTAALFRQDEGVLNADLEKLGDVARRIDADYWLTASDDFANETGTERIQPAVEELLRDRPVAFEYGSVRVWGASPERLRSKYFE